MELRVTAWPAEKVAPIVDEFVAGYHLEHYQCLAERAERLLKKALVKGGEQARLQPWMTTFRAKKIQSVREKLMKRHSEVNFRNFSQIKDDLWDLAGVRVILYSPSEEEHDKIQRFIRSIWGDNVTKHDHPRPEQTLQVEETARRTEADRSGVQEPTMSMSGLESARLPKKYQRRHLGYRAIHYHCRMHKEHKSDRYNYEEGDQVEIQVVSALTHAWATAGHDLHYKSYLYGDLTSEEERVFDALNGLVQSGDLLLEQFQSMVHMRTYRPFEYPHELENYLRKADVLEYLKERPQFESEGLEVLLGFLRHPQVKKDYPIGVREAPKSLGYPGEIPFMKNITRFQPVVACVPGMRLIICIIADNLPKYNLSSAFESSTSDRLCYTMMSAMKLLQNIFLRPEDANLYLQELKMEPDEKTSLDFVLSSEKRQIILKMEGKDKEELKHAWAWFQKQARNPKSICGLTFRLAEMGALKTITNEKLLDGLTMG
jgi:ppGpp synthetase/RelA/SpoT-type nucleotidyltranferase